MFFDITDKVIQGVDIWMFWKEEVARHDVCGCVSGSGAKRVETAAIMTDFVCYDWARAGC
jgi:hypothetical protein